MNLNLNCKGFEPFLYKEREHLGGMQYMFKFENHYGASVIKNMGSYGHEEDLWELAVIKFDEDGDDWDLTYNTSITDDVEGHLTDEDVRNLLQRIKEL